MNRNFMTMTAAMMMVTSACVGPEKAAQAEGPIYYRQARNYGKGRPYDSGDVVGDGTYRKFCCFA